MRESRWYVAKSRKPVAGLGDFSSYLVKRRADGKLQIANPIGGSGTYSDEAIERYGLAFEGMEGARLILTDDEAREEFARIRGEWTQRAQARQHFEVWEDGALEYAKFARRVLGFEEGVALKKRALALAGAKGLRELSAPTPVKKKVTDKELAHQVRRAIDEGDYPKARELAEGLECRGLREAVLRELDGVSW